MKQSLAVLTLVTLFAVGAGSASAADLTLHQVSQTEHVQHDASGIWPDKYLTPFGDPSYGPGATVTIFELKLPSGKLILSQLLSEGCSLQLCPARLASISASGSANILVDDMMYIGAPFVLSADHKVLIIRDYKFETGLK